MFKEATAVCSENYTRTTNTLLHKCSYCLLIKRVVHSYQRASTGWLTLPDVSSPLTCQSLWTGLPQSASKRGLAFHFSYWHNESSRTWYLITVKISAAPSLSVQPASPSRPHDAPTLAPQRTASREKNPPHHLDKLNFLRGVCMRRLKHTRNGDTVPVLS